MSIFNCIADSISGNSDEAFSFVKGHNYAYNLTAYGNGAGIGYYIWGSYNSGQFVMLKNTIAQNFSD